MDAEEEQLRILNFSSKKLKKVPKDENAQNVLVLILDDNELQKIENIDSYLKIEKLSAAKNQLLRMYGVCRLHQLRELNLSHNGIITIEGLKELLHLVRLDLRGNNIKTIEHLTTNLSLEYLNLDENSIGSVADISFLKKLKELHLNGNRLTHLKQCDKYLPVQLETLDLGKNNLADLNDICTLSGLINLNSITISGNPCVQMTSTANGFDYRPFVLNWCMTVQLIDGYVVNPIESLKAEWLYSQGRGRQFRVGEQDSLSRYLSSVCPLSGETLESENERKLRLILSKAQQHQKQLQEEITDSLSNTPTQNSPSSGRKKGVSNRIQSPRFQSRIGVRQGSPDSMTSSYHGNMSNSMEVSALQMSTSLIDNIKKSDVMSQSLDPQVLSNNFKNVSGSDLSSKLNMSSQYPLTAASKMMPVPESLMSPDCGPTTQLIQSRIATVNSSLNKGNSSTVKRENKTMSPKAVRNVQPKRSPIVSPKKVHQKPVVAEAHVDLSSDDDEQVNLEKLKTIRNKAALRTQKLQQQQQKVPQLPKDNESAILIQKMWRGYNTRKRTKSVVEQIQKQRTQEYIEKLTCDMETTKEALENERKIQQLQMQAINALWKKVSAMQQTHSDAGTITNPVNGETGVNNLQVVHDLAETCTVLTNQVQQLQGSMRDILNYMSIFCTISQPKGGVSNSVKDVQTEIVAVHTPQTEQLPFPFVHGGKLARPSTLPFLDRTELNSVNGKLVEDVHAEEASEENLEKIVKEANSSDKNVG